VDVISEIVSWSARSRSIDAASHGVAKIDSSEVGQEIKLFAGSVHNAINVSIRSQANARCRAIVIALDSRRETVVSSHVSRKERVHRSLQPRDPALARRGAIARVLEELGACVHRISERSENGGTGFRQSAKNRTHNLLGGRLRVSRNNAQAHIISAFPLRSGQSAGDSTARIEREERGRYFCHMSSKG